MLPWQWVKWSIDLNSSTYASLQRLLAEYTCTLLPNDPFHYNTDHRWWVRNNAMIRSTLLRNLMYLHFITFPTLTGPTGISSPIQFSWATPSTTSQSQERKNKLARRTCHLHHLWWLWFRSLQYCEIPSEVQGVLKSFSLHNESRSGTMLSNWNNDYAKYR